jgi:hypothetical protein
LNEVSTANKHRNKLIARLSISKSLTANITDNTASKLQKCDAAAEIDFSAFNIINLVFHTA